jgi:hypothetical protein
MDVLPLALRLGFFEWRGDESLPFFATCEVSSDRYVSQGYERTGSSIVQNPLGRLMLAIIF